MKKLLALILVLTASGCSLDRMGRPRPTPQPPPGVIPAPVEPVEPIEPLPPTLSHGGETGWLLGQLWRLQVEPGVPYVWRGMTDFMLAKRYCDTTQRDQPSIDLDAHLTERIGHGAKILRVLGMAHYLERFYPQDYPDYWGCMDRLADQLADRGVRMAYVVFADAPEVMGDRHQQQAHWQGAVAFAARHWNVVGELCNECEKNLTNWRDFPRPSGVRTLWSRGSGLGDAAPPSPGWDWFGWHGRRDWPKVWISSEDMWFVTRGIAGDGRVINPPMIGIADEMIGFAEQNEPGRRSNDCELAASLGFSARAFGSGGTFHTEDGLYSRALGPQQAACAAAFFDALQ